MSTPGTVPAQDEHARIPRRAPRRRTHSLAVLIGTLALGACDAGSGLTAAPSAASRTLAGTATVAWVSPTGSTATNPVTFRADATADIVTIRYYADGTYLLGSSTDRANSFPVTYKFSGVGVRRVYVRGYNSAGTQVAGAYKDFTIRDLIASVPYFFQYANTYEPGATCANTSMAMLLKYYGAGYTPDQIYTEFQKKSQDEFKFDTIFNRLAARAGLKQRIRVHMETGSVAQMEAELNKQHPVVIHGKFTSSGHVMLLIGNDGTSYTMNDPAGVWGQQLCNGSAYGGPGGAGVQYGRAIVGKAITTPWQGNCTTFDPNTVRYHETYLVP
ncbi:MAG TPA: C39 family peptidase [Longimicrobium sp.]|uniref:C39 family peptidase n=1 Tax=Longimicrobium sp. TaxID=2029185 RepID=UPI002ED7ADE0